MKDTIARVHARMMPYATPRRPLHAAEPAAFNGRPVRQAVPYSPMLNPCTEPARNTWGYYDTTCATTTFPQRIFDIVGYSNASVSDANWTPDGRFLERSNIPTTCREFACRNNYTDITFSPYYDHPTSVRIDARCCVAKPPQAWTMLPTIGPNHFQSSSSTRQVRGEPIRGKDGTSVHLTQNEAAKILWDRGYYEYNPANYPDCSYSDVTGFLPIPGAKLYDVDPYACVRGATNTQVAKSIQSSLGLFNTPTPTPVVTSSTTQPEPSSQAISQTQSLATNLATSQTTSQTQSVTPTVVAATTSVGLLNTLAAFVTPVQTAVIAASAPATTITGLAIGLGVLGSGVVIGGAVLAGYKLAQYCRTETPATTNTENIYEELEMNKKEVTDEPAWSNLSECPFERPFAD